MRKILLFVSSLSIFICTGLIWFGIEVAGQFQQLNQEWQQYNNQSTKRNTLLNQMHQHIGYGGFIHQFKNLVLRKNPELIPEINNSLISIYQVIDDYNATTGSNTVAAKQLRETVDHYAEKYTLTKSLIHQNRSIEYTDSHVKVDDKAAVRALAQLAEHEIKSGDRQAKKIGALINKLLGFLLFGAAIVPLIIVLNVWLAVLLIRMRKTNVDSIALLNVQKILQLLPVPMIIARKDGSILYVNEATGKLLNYSIDDLKNKPVEELVPVSSRENHINLRQNFMQDDAERQKAKDVFALTAHGIKIPVAINISSISMPEENLAIVCISDVTKQKQAEQQLQKQVDQYYELSHQDALTKVGNRRFFDDYIELQFNNSVKSSMPLTLFLIDVDEFKKYNDFYGHPAGDKCLQKIAAQIQAVVKRSGDIVARYGGEEFACIFPNLGHAESKLIAQNIINAIQMLSIKHVKSSTKNIVTVSIGCCTFSGEANYQVADLVTTADKQLYMAKNSGRNGHKSAIIGASSGQ